MVIILTLLYCYFAAGIIFATWFVISGVNRLDHGMQDVHWSLRVLLFPGSVLLWIVLLRKYLHQR